ncbi:lysis protein [Pseudomonas sp. B392_1p]|uniref:lysis protein n=1 Tax=Pseudomonas sp. B392_1p TaxID=3457507 RepID=UPI003FD1E1B4
MSRTLAILCGALLLALYVALGALQDQATELATAQADHRQASARADSLADTLRLQRELVAAAAALDTKHTKELDDAKADNDRLRAAVAAGQQRLRVNATCPATSSSGRVVDAGTAELTPQARQDYFALRDELALSRQMILGLQDYVGTVCLR